MLLEPNQRHDLVDLVVHTVPADHGDISPTALALVLEFDGVRVMATGDSSWRPAVFKPLYDLQPDVVLLELPSNSSQTMDAIQKLKSDLPDAGIILSSHEASPQLILSCIRAGAQEFITRPIDEVELDKALEHLPLH